MSWALITGASSGFGIEFARLAARDGHDLILSARSAAKLQALADELTTAHGIEAIVIPADLSQEGEANRLWTEASAERQIGILVNNAGLGTNGPFGADLPRERDSIAVNVDAYTVLLARAAAHMRENGTGRILNVASTAGFMPGPNMAVYHATKAYALHLSEAVAQELSGTGVTVTALCPGATKTEFFSAADVKRTWLMTVLPMADASRVAAKGWRAMMRGRRVIVPGFANKLFAFSPRLTPRRFVPPLVGFFLSRNER